MNFCNNLVHTAVLKVWLALPCIFDLTTLQPKFFFFFPFFFIIELKNGTFVCNLRRIKLGLPPGSRALGPAAETAHYSSTVSQNQLGWLVAVKINLWHWNTKVFSCSERRGALAPWRDALNDMFGRKWSDGMCVIITLTYFAAGMLLTSRRQTTHPVMETRGDSVTRSRPQRAAWASVGPRTCSHTQSLDTIPDNRWDSVQFHPLFRVQLTTGNLKKK